MNGRAKKERKGYLYKRGRNGEYFKANSRKWGIYYLQYDLGGKRYKVCLNTSGADKAEQERKRIMAPLLVADEKEAIGVMKQRLEATDVKLRELDDENNPPLPVEDAWSTYLISPNRPDSGSRTLKGYASQWTQFARWLGQAHPNCAHLRDVTPEIVQEYAAYLLNEVKGKVKTKKGMKEKVVKKAYTTNTYNKHVRLLELVFHILQNKAKMTFNPWTEIARKAENKASRRELTIGEINTIVNNVKGELKTLLILGIYTGMRLGDCCTLRWSEVDMDRRIILRVPSKIARRKNNPVHIPIHPTLYSFLCETPKTERKGDVLPGFAGQYQKNDSDVTKQLRRHFISCGIQVHKKGTGKGTGKRAVVEVGFHSLRHSFVSLCREANTPLAVVEAIVGHSNPAMTRHYTHVGDLAASQAVAALPSFTDEGKGKKQKQQEVKTLDDALEVLSKVRSIVEKSTAKTWARDRKKIIEVVC